MNRLFLLGFALLLAGLFCLAQEPRAQVPMTGAGLGVPVAGGCTTPTFSQDGTQQAVSASAASVTTPAFSTTYCNDLIVVIAGGNEAGINSVTDSQGHLTFTQRVVGTSSILYIWTAPLSGAAISGDTVTVNFANTGASTAIVAAFSGYKTATPFDPNGAIPAISGAQCSWTTSNANDILYGVGISNTTSPDSGWTFLGNSISAAAFVFAEYKVVSATQSGTVAATVSGTSICDAIQKGP